MNYRTHVLCLAAALVVAASSSVALGEEVLTPAAAGAATGSMYFPLQNAFDGQPTWDSQYEEPTGGGSGNDAPYYDDRHGYIDFGEDYADVRITECWTMYRTWSVGDQLGYTNAWWDDDKDCTNDDGVVEYDINFNTAQDLSTGTTTPWIIDVDASADPIIPQRRYLILHSDPDMTNRAKEYAIIGWIQTNYPPSVNAGDDAMIVWPEDEVALDATVSDDGLPDPPASLDLTWTKQSGPGTVNFDNDSIEDATATFGEEGVYVLRLTADDGEYEIYDEVTITVQEQYVVFPADAGAATGSGYFPMQNAFNGGAYWLEDEPGGGEVGADAPAYADRYGYVDFGPDWEDVRIAQCWTLYRSWSGGNQTPYAEVWWDDDKDITNDDGVAEYDINFNSAQGLSNIGSTQWAIDLDTVSSPIAPSRRFLIFKSPATMTNRAKEYAFVGWYTTGRPANVAPTVEAGDYQEITWPTSQVNLDATVMDDGQPDPVAGFDVLWTKESGPGSVNFGDDEAIDTTATFSAVGTYVLRLTADDGELEDYDEVTITVTPSSITFPSLSLPGPQVFNYGQLALVDEVICGDAQDPHSLIESSQGISSISTILGSSCRVMANTGNEPKYFGYVLGEDCDLEAGAAYILVVEYPDDQSRSMIVANHGCETNHGFHTGRTTGDCLTPAYVGNANVESMHYGFTGAFETFEQLFWLHDRFPDIEVPRGEGSRPYVPDDGFQVLIAQYAADEDPLSAGAAVKRIALYEAPSLASITQTLNVPEDLPKRRLFWREEMADGVISSSTATLRGVAEDVDWYDYKMRLSKFLGMNTFCKDLLEFGHCQGWDVSYYDDSNGTWFNRSSTPFRWEEMINLATETYEMEILPYYEYAGGDGTGPQAIGRQNRCLSLAGNTWYTHISWSESLSIDVTDPDGLTDGQRLLEQSMLVYTDGNRPISLPVTGGATATWKAGYWGYVDFGADYANVRIRQCWTRSRMWHGGDATPYSQVYWHTTYSGFDGDTVPQGAIQETSVDFITQRQVNTAPRWSKDLDLDAQNAITPSARYLVMRAPDPIRDCQEYLFVGTIVGQGDDLQTIPVTAGSVTGFSLASLFDNQPGFFLEPVNFAGAWIRNRVSMLPISFSDDTLDRFSDDVMGGETVTRTMLQGDPFLLADYYDWWYPERKTYVDALVTYMRNNGMTDAMMLYTPDNSEPGVSHPTRAPDIITDDTATWSSIVGDPMHLDEALGTDLHYEAMVLNRSTWGSYEWQHSVPHQDPWNYSESDGSMMTYGFNQLYTVSEPWGLEQFEIDDGGIAAVRHYCLNEDMMTNSSEEDLLGYFVADIELAGPYCVLPEARMVAYGNPYYIAYLAGSSFTRGFPGYAREFNANFLALPALPLVTEEGAASTGDVVVRSIETASDGTWLAIVNVSLEDQEDVVVTLPVSGTVTDAVTGSAISVSNGTITLDLWPGQLKSVHIAE